MFVNLDCSSPAAERRDEEDGLHRANLPQTAIHLRRRNIVTRWRWRLERGALWVMLHLQEDWKGGKKRKKDAS